MERPNPGLENHSSPPQLQSSSHLRRLSPSSGPGATPVVGGVADASSPAATGVPSVSPPGKRRRTSTSIISGGCRTCRLRKVKCSGNPGNGPCTNCARLELTCPFDKNGVPPDNVARTTPSQSHTEAGTIRKRAQRACKQCHSQKTKCSGDLPRCKRCEAGGLECEYIPAKRKFANVRLEPPTPSEEMGAASSTTSPSKPAKSVSPSPSNTSSKSTPRFPLAIDTSTLTQQEMLTRKDFLLQHLEAYFEHLYWLPCLGFFHPQTAFRQVYEGTFDAPTATAICAVSSFFVNPSKAGQEFAAKCSDELDFFVFKNIHKFNEGVLVPYALNLSYNFLKGSFAKAWQCFGLATRLMTGLQLNWDVSRNKTFAEQETMRRIAWQFFCMDRLLAGGYEEYIACRAENMKICLPCNETAYWENKPVSPGRLHDKPVKSQAIGLHGLNIRISDLNHRIQAWNKRLSARAPLEPSKVMEDINNFQTELTRFHACIPDDVRLSDQSIAKYMASPERVGYVYMHTHLSVCHIDLYRFALPGILDPMRNNILQRLPRDFVERSRKQAIAHALCTGRFCVAIQDAMERTPNPGRTALAGDCTIPYMATQSLRVFLITMENKLYDNLTNDTTAPLWRFEPPSEPHIRHLISHGLFRVSEPWCGLFSICSKTHASNKAMMAEFDRTHKFYDQKGTVGFSGPEPMVGAATRLPGPHYILENAHNGVVEQEKRKRATEAATANRWFGDSNLSPSSPAGPSHQAAYTPPASDYEMEYDPPGVPLFLAAARYAAMEQTDEADSHNVDTEMYHDMPREQALGIPDKMWFNEGMLPVMQLDEAPDTIMFPPPDPQGPPSHYVPTQPNMFVGGYHHPYAATNGGSNEGGGATAGPSRMAGGPEPGPPYMPQQTGGYN